MWKFLQHVNSKYKLALDDYPSLYRWSVENVAEFWGEVWHFTGIRSSKPFDQVGCVPLVQFLVSVSRFTQCRIKDGEGL